jgi:hypothetical protein
MTMSDSSEANFDQSDHSSVRGHQSARSDDQSADAMSVNLGHFLGASDFQEHLVGTVRAEWKAHFALHPTSIPRPASGVVATIISCPQRGAVHVSVASRRTVLLRRLAAGAGLLGLVGFDLAVWLLILRPRDSSVPSVLGALLTLSAMASIIPILRCLLKLTQLEMNLALRIDRQPGGIHSFFSSKEGELRGSRDY